MARAVTTSVVFTDLVGSTEMASRLGPLATDEVRQVHFGLLRDAIFSAEGTEVKNLGDGLMAIFDSLGAALNGAVAIQQAIARHNDKGGEPLAVRVGVSSGDATTEDGDFFGPPVVEAARLCAKAEGGQILTTEMVSLFARTSEHRFTSVGELELKGIPIPVSAMELGWDRAADPASVIVPFPSRLASSFDSDLVGRAPEWSVLQQTEKRARAGARQLVLVSGEPGIGKTRLTSGACRAAFEAGAIVLYGRCDEDLGVPYQPWVEIIGHLVEHIPDDLLGDHLAYHGGEVTRLVPHLTRRFNDIPPVKASDPETERYLLFQAIADLIERCATETMVVLLLDDLHWADKPSLMLLRHLVSQSAVQPLLILGTYRDSDVSKGSALADALAALRRESGIERIALSGLDDAGVLALLESIAGHTIEEASGVTLAHAIGHETSGNPFFVGEILRYLSESGTISQGSDGRWNVQEEPDGVFLPESVREVIGQRVGRLGNDVVRVLSAASIIGRDFDLSVLARVLEEDEDRIFEYLEQARHAALIGEVRTTQDRYTFRHALVQHSLDSDLTARVRRQLHQRTAEVLEEMVGQDPGDRVGELAAHWLAATVTVDPMKALHYARLAGEQALARLAPDEAIRWFASALDLMAQCSAADHPGRCALLNGLGIAQRQVGDPAFCQTLLESAALAQQIGDTSALVVAALANNRGATPSILGTVDASRTNVLYAALEAVGPQDSSDRARLLSLLALEMTIGAPYQDRLRIVDEAVGIARRLGDPVALAEALIRPYAALLVPAAQDRRLADATEARELARHAGDPFMAFWAAIWLGVSACERGDLAAFDESLEEASTIAHDIPQPTLTWVVTYNKSMRATATGDPDEGERLATLALELATEGGEADGFTYFGTQLMGIRRFQGRCEEILPLVAQVAEEHPGMPGYKAVLAACSCESEHNEEARALLDIGLASEFDLPYDITWSTSIGAWALAAAHLQDVRACEVLYPILLPFENHLPVSGLNVGIPLAELLGELAAVLGRAEDAEGHFKVSEQICKRFGAPYFLARTYLGWATALMRADDSSRGRDFAQRAIEHSQGRFAMVDRRAAVLLDS